MNSHASLSCLLAVIANFIPEAAVSGARIVSRLVIMADRNSNLLIVLKKAVSAGSKITDPITSVIKIPPIKITAGDSVMEIQCCEPNVIFTNEERHMFCQSMDDHMLRTVYRCHDVTLYDDGNPENVTVVYWTLVKTAWYQLTFLALTILPFCLMVISALVYHLSESFEHSQCVENLTKSIALPFSPRQSHYRLSQTLNQPVKLYKNKWQIHLFDELLSLMMVVYCKLYLKVGQRLDRQEPAILGFYGNAMRREDAHRKVFNVRLCSQFSEKWYTIAVINIIQNDNMVKTRNVI
ncbi:uncharacterized protein LOC132944939 [Metopolophium dirhodum]|uniref:uncharacterized protein LOC132944939 n=1 Tax=Metopolophium dirhodum TaxID=44670 RepID=UPI00298F44B8|nr:uncharacterized protein LOC132944939 [Metopolophium dirhodum]